MSRFKTFIFSIFVLVALGVGIYAYYHLKSNKKPELDALNVLPDNCLVYLNTKNFSELDKKINSQSLIADKLKLFGEINSFCNIIQTFDSLILSDGDVKETIEDNVIHFASYTKKQNWLVAFNIKQLGEQEYVAEHLATILKAIKNKSGVYAFTMQSMSMYFNLNEGVVTISNAPDLIDQSLDKKNVKLFRNPDFIQFKNTLTENSLMSIYVNHQLFEESDGASKLNLSYACNKGFSSGALDIQPSQLKVNGYVKPQEDEIIALFVDQKPQSNREFLAELPQNTCYFKAYGFSSYPELRIGFPLTNTHIKYWMRANERGLYNVEDDFYGNVTSHVVEFETFSPSQKYVFLEVNDTLKAAENLRYMSDSIIRKDSLTLIYRLNDSIEKPLQLFIPLSKNNTNYAVVYDSHIFFGDKPDELMSLISDLKYERLLLNNQSFVSYSNQNFLDKFNYLIYNSPNRTKNINSSFFNFKTNADENPFANFRHLSYTVSNQNNVFKFRFHMMYETENINKEQNVLWTLNLENNSTMPASGFVNHNTGENELVIQDENNILYLINAKGTVLWKKKLTEKILSPFYRVDVYKNNKYQILFNTKNQIHLIDRNGNNVESYPVKLPSEATSNISLFDYENDKEYRVFVACKNNNIYNYNIRGTLQDKFITVKTDEEVNLPVQYVNVGLSDYLVAIDKEGKIYTFSRKGLGRIGLRNRTNVNCSSFYVDASNSVNSTCLVYVDDKNGIINKISFDDKKEIIKLKPNIENASVDFMLVDGNRSMDMIVTKDKIFRAYNLTGNLILEGTSAFDLSETNYYGDESHSVFYSLSADKTELSVFDQIKSRTKTFKATALPLVSNLFKDNKKYMIITNGSQLTCVLVD
jgi:hypothetical protein